MRMRTYEFTVKHDGGTVKIRTRAQNVETARMLICKAEGCPESALGDWCIITPPARPKWYVGIREGSRKREVFSDIGTPTLAQYPQYVAVIGPHHTKRGAEFMAKHGGNNPHLQTAADADRIASL